MEDLPWRTIAGLPSEADVSTLFTPNLGYIFSGFIPDADIPSVQSLDAESVPEWVVALADNFGTTVDELRSAVNVEEADGVIDKLVEQVQCGYMAIDVAIEDLTKMGLSKDIATNEMTTRINA